MRVLTVNAGSSTLKLALVEDGQTLADELLETPDGRIDEAELARFAESLGPFACSAHRIVHGGRAFSRPTVIDDDVRAALADVADLAPLHSAPALRALDAVRRVAPDRAAVACFDTAFHASIPDAAAVYAVPWRWTSELGIRRYGFHGLSHSFASRRAAELLGRPPDELRLVTCHLGAGASLAAIRAGRSVDTTMGFTPLEGLVMATRSGSIDPGALIWLQRHAGIAVDDLEHALAHESGVAGISGGSGDMRTLLDAAGRGDERAALALDVYLHRLRALIAAMVAAAGGLDALVFTGGVGEHAAAVRSAACEGLAFLGIALDPNANEAGSGDRDVAASESQVRVLVLAAREDLELAAQASALLGGNR